MHKSTYEMIVSCGNKGMTIKHIMSILFPTDTSSILTIQDILYNEGIIEGKYFGNKGIKSQLLKLELLGYTIQDMRKFYAVKEETIAKDLEDIHRKIRRKRRHEV